MRGAPVVKVRSAPFSGCGLRAAYEGWVKVEPRKKSTQLEFARGIDRFIELHGDLEAAQINRPSIRKLVDRLDGKPARTIGPSLRSGYRVKRWRTLFDCGGRAD